MKITLNYGSGSQVLFLAWLLRSLGKLLVTFPQLLNELLNPLKFKYSIMCRPRHVYSVLQSIFLQTPFRIISFNTNNIFKLDNKQMLKIDACDHSGL